MNKKETSSHYIYIKETSSHTRFAEILDAGGLSFHLFFLNWSVSLLHENVLLNSAKSLSQLVCCMSVYPHWHSDLACEKHGLEKGRNKQCK